MTEYWQSVELPASLPLFLGVWSCCSRLSHIMKTERCTMTKDKILIPDGHRPALIGRKAGMAVVHIGIFVTLPPHFEPEIRVGMAASTLMLGLASVNNRRMYFPFEMPPDLRPMQNEIS